MIVRIFLTQEKDLIGKRIYVLEKELFTTTKNNQINITYLFHYMISQITKPLFQDGTFNFHLESIEYWTLINQNQQFINIDTQALKTFTILPPMTIRHTHHLIDLNVIYSKLN